jgi:hypothetical protein
MQGAFKEGGQLETGTDSNYLDVNFDLTVLKSCNTEDGSSKYLVSDGLYKEAQSFTHPSRFQTEV